MREVVRVQDRHGRGPYRPGVPALWSDPLGFDCPPWWIEIGEDCAAAHERMVGDYHFGCGFSSLARLAEWFNARELRKLDALGYKLAVVEPAIIIAETPKQVVFGASKPLASFPMFKIGSAAAAQRTLASEAA